jgi:hypothetical protein
MRRTSRLAVDVSRMLADGGLEVSPRRLEGWTLEGLGADESLPIADQVAHYQKLAKVTGPGRGRNADAAARRLAAHEFACRRLRVRSYGDATSPKSDSQRFGSTFPPTSRPTPPSDSSTKSPTA